MAQKWYARSNVVHAVIYSRRYSLIWLRHLTVGSLCADPRDRVYALLGLLDDDGKQLGIVPDYSKNESEVYRDVSIRYITTWGDLELLCSCGQVQGNPGTPSSDSSTSTSTPISTWVTDWSVPQSLAVPIRLERILCHFQALVEYRGNGVLRAAGVSVGIIRDFIELAVATPQALAASIREVVPCDATDKPYPGGGNLCDAFRFYLCAEFFCDRTLPHYVQTQKTDIYSLTIQESKEAMRRILAAEDQFENNFLIVVDWLYQTGQFFTTREGYIGWSPKMANTGCQIVSFLGCRLPMIARRSSVDGSCFEIIGPCYLHGFMFGEAFLGPLLDGISPVLHMNDWPYIPRLHDSRTGDLVATEDPRLSTLPVDLVDFRKQRERGR